MLQLLVAGFSPQASGGVDNGTGLDYADDAWTANPALNITYFFTKNIAAQTVLAVPLAKIAVEGNGQTINATEQWVLPLSLIGQYHFLSDEIISPYIGGGLTYAMFWEEKNKLNNSHFNVDDTWGGVVNFGATFKIPESNWNAVLDVKKWWLAPANVSIGGNDFGDVTVNPWFIGGGVGYTFSTPALF